MSKPEWNEDTPKWANWLAQNKDGSWYFYENKPSKRNILGEFVCEGRRQYVPHSATGWNSSPEWKKTLEHRP